jgi:hypothetical protein
LRTAQPPKTICRRVSKSRGACRQISSTGANAVASRIDAPLSDEGEKFRLDPKFQFFVCAASQTSTDKSAIVGFEGQKDPSKR